MKTYGIIYGWNKQHAQNVGQSKFNMEHEGLELWTSFLEVQQLNFTALILNMEHVGNVSIIGNFRDLMLVII